MGLDIPTLDDRTYEEILAAARDRIPVHADEWTDHNVHDPGITILELLAWIAETHRYRLDRVTDEHVRAYLGLLGDGPAPPTPATGRVRFSGAAGAPVGGRAVPEGTVLTADRVGEGRTDGDGTLSFATTEAITLTDARLARVVTEHRRGSTDSTAANETDGMQFLAFGEEAERGSALYLGFETDPFADADEIALGVDYHDATLPPPATHSDEPVTFEPSVELAWQYLVDPDQWYRGDAWRPLEVGPDETRRFYRGGTVGLEIPGGESVTPGVILDGERSFYWLRCRVETAGYEIPPALDALRTNVVGVRHEVAVTDATPLERAGGGRTTTAAPDQVFEFGSAPVRSATVAVGGETWDRVDEFHGSGPDDREFVLEESAGEIRFGDGLQGEVPAAGQPVVVETHSVGGGTRGNVPSSARWSVADDPHGNVAVTAVEPPAGGSDAEPLDDAVGRVRRELRTPFRAVSLSDVEDVATHTPGLRFGRAKALVRSRDPGDDCEPQGDVVVVAVPHSPLDRPEPSEGFLDAVDCHLKTHALLTDRISAVPPTYVGIGVDVAVRIEDGYSTAGRTAAIETRLDEYLHPLTGFEGDGWPFGRAVYRSELFATIEAVEGIDCVLELAVDATGEFELVDGDVVILDDALVTPTDHDVTVRVEGGRCGGDSR